MMSDTIGDSSGEECSVEKPVTIITEDVGIDTLQEQIRQKVLKRGFEFNVIVVGRSGLGKSTLINTLFKANVSRRTCHLKSEDAPIKFVPQKIPQTTEIKSVSHVLEEKNVQLRLTITDTPGFGDQINNENCWVPILNYINEQYLKYLDEEQTIFRKRHITDSRVHCCLYFIPPTGHSLSALDIEFMKRLGKVVNIIPVIAKADTLTIEERMAFKQRILRQIENCKIDVYPLKSEDNDSVDEMCNKKIREMIPFAVVGSSIQHKINGHSVYGRKTEWGIVEVENRAHCEFPHLRDMLIRTHMQDLVDVTKHIHYENFRSSKLQEFKTMENKLCLNGRAIDIASLNESSL